MLIDILHLCEMMTNIVLQLMPTLSPTEYINFPIIIHATKHRLVEKNRKSTDGNPRNSALISVIGDKECVITLPLFARPLLIQPFTHGALCCISSSNKD